MACSRVCYGRFLDFFQRAWFANNVLLLLFLIAGDREYVWQRSDSRDVIAASAQTDRELAVLVIENGVVIRRQSALFAREAVSIVARLDQLGSLDALFDIAAASPGVRAIELDFDCPTSKLLDYEAVLKDARQRAHALGKELRITALPAWLGHTTFAYVDAVTLQVHAVSAPVLFDAEAAWRAIAKMPNVRFSVALPTYGTTLSDGSIIAADPAAVAEFARALNAAPPPGFEGIAWFRMPVETDASTWSRRTLNAVVTNRVGASDLRVASVAHANGARFVEVHNRGGVDALFQRACVEAARGDGSAGFAWDGSCFTPTRARFIRPGETVRLGWVR
jgi:hypothetical protein